MSTRATYSIGNMTFYCHYDGYPSGAAERFANMVRARYAAELRQDRYPLIDRKGGWAYAFIRGNDDAEPAYDNAHTGHGDTEWRYMLAEDRNGVLGMQVTHRPDVGTDDWVLDFRGEFIDWLPHATSTATYSGGTMGIRKVCHDKVTAGRTMYLHCSTARELERAFRHNREVYRENGPVDAYYTAADLFAEAGK